PAWRSAEAPRLAGGLFDHDVAGGAVQLDGRAAIGHAHDRALDLRITREAEPRADRQVLNAGWHRGLLERSPRGLAAVTQLSAFADVDRLVGVALRCEALILRI